jgi:hypothetical protein
VPQKQNTPPRFYHVTLLLCYWKHRFDRRWGLVLWEFYFW